VQRVPEAVPGYPERILPVDEKAAAILRKRTLTNLYNERPAGPGYSLTRIPGRPRPPPATAVAGAYGWPADLTDEQILEHLFKLNQTRAAAQ
jgi:hypothetical protein